MKKKSSKRKRSSTPKLTFIIECPGLDKKTFEEISANFSKPWQKKIKERRIIFKETNKES